MPGDQRVCFILRVRQDRVQEYRARQMAGFFELEKGTAPDAAMEPLAEVFHLD